MSADLLGLTDAARIAGVTPGALRRAARIGALEAVRVGARTWAVTREALAAYLVWTSQKGWLADPFRQPGPRPREAEGPRPTRKRRRSPPKA